MNTDAMHAARRMFAYHNGCLFCAPEGDTRSHEEWFQEIHLKIDQATRGYVKPGLLCIYVGKDFAIPDDWKVVLRAVSHLARDYRIGIGMNVGPVGVEWTPQLEFRNYSEALNGTATEPCPR